MFERNGGSGRQLRDRPQLKAARVSEADDETGGDTNEEVDGARELEDGSQWESASEGEGSLHSHGEPAQLNKISVTDIMSEPEGSDVVYVRAVREKVVSIQKENPSRATMHPEINRPRCSKAYESCLAAYVHQDCWQ